MDIDYTATGIDPPATQFEDDDGSGTNVQPPTWKEVVRFQASHIVLAVGLLVFSSLMGFTFFQTLQHEFPPIDVLPVLVSSHDGLLGNPDLVYQLELFFLSHELFLREHFHDVTLCIIPRVIWSPSRLEVSYKQALQNLSLETLLSADFTQAFSFSKRLLGGVLGFAAIQSAAYLEAREFIHKHIFTLLQFTELPGSLNALDKWPNYFYFVNVAFLGSLVSQSIIVSSSILTLLIVRNSYLIYVTFILTTVGCCALLVFKFIAIVAMALNQETAFEEYNRLLCIVSCIELGITGSLFMVCYRKSKQMYKYYFDDKEEVKHTPEVQQMYSPLQLPATSSKYSSSISPNFIETALNVVSNLSKEMTLSSPHNGISYSPELVQQNTVAVSVARNMPRLVLQSAPVLPGASEEYMVPDSGRRNTWQNM